MDNVLVEFASSNDVHRKSVLICLFADVVTVFTGK